MSDTEIIQKQIHQALIDADVDKLIMLLKDDDVDIDFRDVTHDLQTILMKLCYVKMDITSLTSVLETMFDKFPNVNIQDSWGRTVLMHACIANKPSIIEGLLEYEHTDVALTDFDGNSALSYAVQNCDIYTLEDILQHVSGPRLLTLHNSKGQTPVSIAEKSGDKTVIKLFKSYLDKTVGLQQKKKNRNHRHRDVIKLKPSQAHAQERLSLSSAPVEKVSNFASTEREMENQLLCRPRLNISKAIKNRDQQEKCDSAPVTRTNSLDKSQIVTSLHLSSPKLQRRFHKENSLLEECFKRNNINLLPSMGSTTKPKEQYSETGFHLPEHSIRRQRRPSISLPDLRNVTGCLVNSGSSTPSSDNRDESDDHASHDFRTINDETNDDDVFAQTFPKQKLKLHKTSSKQSLSDVKVSLPDINKSVSKQELSYGSKRSFQHLNRPRKFSNSDDQIQRTLVVNDNG